MKKSSQVRGKKKVRKFIKVQSSSSTEILICNPGISRNVATGVFAASSHRCFIPPRGGDRGVRRLVLGRSSRSNICFSALPASYTRGMWSGLGREAGSNLKESPHPAPPLVPASKFFLAAAQLRCTKDRKWICTLLRWQQPSRVCIFFLEIIDFILPLHSTHLKHRQQLANA